MLLSSLFTTHILMEAKARIEHPEDLIFDHGLSGAKTALHILQTTADQPQSVSIKFDGSPSLIAGWRGNEFVLTDKAGFGAKGYDGMTTSGDAIENMIMSRKQKDTSPQAVAKRSAYAKTIASLYPILRDAIPKSFQGYAQTDLLWVGVPKIVDGMYEFKPNKVVYRVGQHTELGKQIAQSKVGMVVHSIFASQQDQEPDALRDVASLGWKIPGDLVVVPHEIEFKQKLSLNKTDSAKLQKIIQTKGKKIDKFFDPLSLTDRNIKALPNLMKSFLAYKAGKGSNDFGNVAQEFVDWLASSASKASSKMQAAVGEWLKLNLDGYNATWQIVQLLVDLKLDLKSQMDQQVGNIVSAHLDQAPGHEGFVSVTPQGIIKLVNRAEFMKKDQPVSEAEQGKHVSWAFGRMNPPTLGHQHLVDTVAKNANGGDYWIFLSHSQDPKQNPLPHAEKKHFAQMIMPKHAQHFDVPEDIRTFLQAADWLYKQGYRSMTFVAGGDRLPEFEKHLNTWNSQAVRDKYPLEINGQMQTREAIPIQYVSSGERDPDASEHDPDTNVPIEKILPTDDTDIKKNSEEVDLTAISGTKARKAVANNDLTDFEKYTGLKGSLAQQLFDAVKLGIQAAKPAKTNKVKEQMMGTISAPEQEDHSKGTIVKLRLANECAQQLYEWCQQHNINCMDPHDFHMTLVFSPTPAPQLGNLHATSTHIPADIKGWKILGEHALVLDLHCPLAEQMHKRMLECGASHSYPTFIPHTSVVYGWNSPQLPDQLPPFDLLYEMVEVEPLDPNWGVVKKA